MNYFITEEGLNGVRQTEESLIQQYGSLSAMRLQLQREGVKLYGMDDDDERDTNPVACGMMGKVCVLKIDGPTRDKANWLTRAIGWPTYDDIKERLQQTWEDSSCMAVVMDINSPGGQAQGTNAMSKFISDFNKKVKPVIGYTSGLCASAAVWYGTAGSALAADPDADVGSIGAVNVFTSYYRAQKAAGYDTTVTRSGPYKAVPNSMEKLDDRGQEVLTEEVQKWHNRFLVGLSGNIGMKPEVINKTIANGKVFTAQQALNLGLVQSLISFEQLIANLNAKLDNNSRAR
jgi:signal peptide peptidase SppA